MAILNQKGRKKKKKFTYIIEKTIAGCVSRGWETEIEKCWPHFLYVYIFHSLVIWYGTRCKRVGNGKTKKLTIDIAASTYI